MSLRLLLSAIALPPIAFVLLAIAGWLLAARWRRTGRAIGAAALLGLLVLSLPATAKLLTAPLEAGLPLTPPANDPPQAIVILAAGVWRGGGTSPRILIGPRTLWRVLAGVRLQRRTHLPILVTGGRPAPNQQPIAALMAQTLAEDFGTTARWQEDRSRDTWRNAAYSAPMLLRDGIHSIYLVTSPFHERRALIAFGRFPLTLTAAPPVLDIPPVLTGGDFVPSLSGGWAASYDAIHEWVGCAWYALRRRFEALPDAP